VGLDSDEKRLDYIQEKIERPWDQEPLLETDKAWDAIHRCLTDGSLEVVRSSSPLGKLICRRDSALCAPAKLHHQSDRGR